MSTPVLEAAQAVGLPHRVIGHGAVGSLAEAARARGVAPADVVKTLVAHAAFLRIRSPSRAEQSLACSERAPGRCPPRPL